MQAKNMPAVLINGENCDCSVIFKDFVKTLKTLFLWTINMEGNEKSKTHN